MPRQSRPARAPRKPVSPAAGSRSAAAFDRAVAAFEAGRTSRARSLCRDIVRRQPDHFGAWHLLGVIALQNRQFEDAVGHLQKAVGIDQDNAQAQNNLAIGLCGLDRHDEAVACYDRAIALSPGQAYLHFNRANALRDLQRYDDAVAAYDQAIALRPDYATAYANRGATLRALGREAEAMASYDRALALHPDYVEALSNRGNLLCDLDRHEEGIASYRKALALSPDHAETWLFLANAHATLGRHDDAIECYRKALALRPDLTDALRNIATLTKFTERDDTIAAMEKAWARGDLNDEQRMHLAFGLGKAFEDLRQYDDAFEYFIAANALKRASYDYATAEDEAQFAAIKAIFTERLFDANRGAGTADDTPIFILGMPRSGTTLVEQILASHPDVYGAGELPDLERTVIECFGEIGGGALADGIARADADAFRSAGDKYVAGIRARAGTSRFITDKMPHNFLWIGMIHLMLPNARIIHCRRDPVDTCLSIFKKLFAAEGHYYAYELGELGRYYGLYEDLMRHWHAVLPGAVFDVCYEELIADQEGRTRALLDHCGLAWDEACLQFHKTVRPVKTASSAQVRTPIYASAVRSWTHYEGRLQPLLDALPSATV